MRRLSLLVIFMLLALSLCSVVGAGVADAAENGISFWQDYRQPYFVLDTNHADRRLLSTHIERFEEMRDSIGGTPNWTVTPVDPDNMPFDYHVECREEEVIIHMDDGVDIPSLPSCSVSFDITCEWGDYSNTERVTLKFDFLPDGMPSGYANLPMRLTMKTGDTVNFLDK